MGRRSRMRTTLKRGIGQAAGLNGNGQSAPPPLRRSLATASPTRARGPLIGLILRGFGWLVLAVAVVERPASPAGSTCTRTRRSSAISTTRQLINADNPAHEIASPSSPAIALVAGYDIRGKTWASNPYAGSNSDTLMLLRADPTTNTLSLLSFPRDLYVNIYCHGARVYTTGPHQLGLGELRQQRAGGDARHDRST